VTGFAEPDPGGDNRMLQTRRLEDKLPLATAMLSNLALALLMWNLALRVALVLGRWAAGAGL
jgi:hypothetical protein